MQLTGIQQGKVFAKVKVNWYPFLSITKPHMTDPGDFPLLPDQSYFSTK